jgi:hypothetical protein
MWIIAGLSQLNESGRINVFAAYPKTSISGMLSALAHPGRNDRR